MARSAQASRGVRAGFIPPMKALGVRTPPAGRWHCEIKFDGYRAVAVLERGRAELWSRNRNSLASDYPEVVEAVEGLPCRSAVLDGEVAALDARGRSRFQLLQQRGVGERPPIIYYLFDLMQLDGRSLLARPIEERRAALDRLVGPRNGGVLRLSPVFDRDPESLLEHVRREGLEGIVMKAPGSVYEPDRRSGAWLKCRVSNQQEFVIGGFTPPRGGRTHFGAIVVGYYRGGDLIYAGKVGTGYDRRSLEELHRRFLQLRSDRNPFADLPKERRPRFGRGMTAAGMREVTWLRPKMVCQVRFAEWTEDGQLRQPVFLGLREDKPARAVVREAPAASGGGG